MKVLILANGDPPSQELLRRLISEHDLFLATDGAAFCAAAFGQVPDLISGDFDSLSLEEAQRLFPQSELVVTPDQNRADLEKAIGLARDRGAMQITITGAVGGRVDHMLGNFSLLQRYHREMDLAIVDDLSHVRALSGDRKVTGKWALEAVPGDIISLLALDEEVRATVLGVQWPLNDESLPIGTFGISNRAVSTQVLIQARVGALLACHLKQMTGVIK